MILHPEELDRSSFRKLGDFEDLLTTSDTYSGKKTEEGFFPDVLRLSSNGKDTSVSVTKVCGKNRTITSCEIHSDCCEGVLPLDGDIYLYPAVLVHAAGPDPSVPGAQRNHGQAEARSDPRRPHFRDGGPCQCFDTPSGENLQQ